MILILIKSKPVASYHADAQKTNIGTITIMKHLNNYFNQNKIKKKTTFNIETFKENILFAVGKDGGIVLHDKASIIAIVNPLLALFISKNIYKLFYWPHIKRITILFFYFY